MCFTAVRLLAMEVRCLPAKQVPLGNCTALEHQGGTEVMYERTAADSGKHRVIILVNLDAEHFAE